MVSLSLERAPEPGRQQVALIAAALLPLVLFAWSGSLPLDNDALYADVARNMLRTGDLLDPNIHGVPFLDKPPLFFWVLAASQALLGDNIFALRLPALLAGLLTVWLVYRAARAGNGPYAGLVAAGTLLGTPLWLEYARRVYMEVPVGLCVLASVLAFERARGALQRGERAGAAFALAGTFLGLGFMVKSLVGLFGGIGFAAWLLLETRGRALADRRLWAGAAISAALAFAIAAPWHIQQLLSQRELFLEFTWRLHVEQQVLSAQPWSTGPVWFYLEVFALQQPLFGIVTLAGGALLVLRMRRGKETAPLDRLVAVTGLTMLLVLSVSETKKDLYLIPLAPLSALLFGRQLAALSHTLVRRCLAAVVPLGLLLDVPLWDPSGSALRGAAPLVPSALAARDASRPGAPLHVVDLYFVASQYYSERRAISVFTQPGPERLTGHIPYIRHGHNMRDVPLPELPSTMRAAGGLWLLPAAIFGALRDTPQLPLAVLHRDAGFVLVRAEQAR
jgi:4-amino-4-deoxy-L-arabinose transferase-like glycosyltransferase